jgi:TRAP-type mannitol/chloroaromatic compound transport system permease small subunit
VIDRRLNKVERAIQFLFSLLDRVCNVCCKLSGVAVFLLAFVITYNVACRYIFKYQNPYVYVISCILMLLCVVFSISYTQNVRQHLRVDLLDRFIPDKIKEILLNIVGPILGLICIAILTWKSWEPAWFALITHDTYGSGLARFPTWPSRMMVTLGAGLLGLVLLAQFFRYLLRGRLLEGKK